MEYAGENTLNGGSYLLGETSTSVGIDFPKLGRYFDATFELSEWQNGWYTNNPFLDGRSNDGIVLGHWGGDQRVFNDGVGARSLMARVGWVPQFGGYLEERVRYLVNQEYGVVPYRHYMEATVRYSRPWNELTVGGEVDVGKDVFGKSFSRLSGFVRYGGDQRTRGYDTGDDGDSADSVDSHGGELFVDAGVNANKVRIDLNKILPLTTSPIGYGYHFGLGARRAVSEHNDLGVRLEADQVDGHNLLGFRFVDYRHRFGEHFAMGALLGVARYDVATPAYSLYGGIGTQWRNVLPKWDVGLDFRYAQNIARNHVLASDPAGRPDSFYKIQSVISYITRRF
jgi:hypothetical protein